MFAIIEAAGWPIWPIILASVIALAIIGERLWSLRTSMVMPKNLLPQVVHEYRQNGPTAQLVSRLSGGPPLGQVFAAGIKNIKSPPAVMKEAIEEAAQSVAIDLERFLTTLGTIASIAPLLGLFGTVIGMIEIFGSQTPQGGNPAGPRPRHLDRALQHRIRPGGRGARHDLLPAFPLEGGRDAGGHRAAGDQAGGNHPRRAPGMRLRPRAYREEPEINFIPLIDVLLVILIFLMVTTTYSRFAELQINLPTAEAERQPERADQIDVAVDSQGNYSVNKKAVALSGSAPLSQEMRRIGASMKDPIVVISADARAPHQSVITVMEAARMAGYGKITFTTQAAPK